MLGGSGATSSYQMEPGYQNLGLIYYLVARAAEAENGRQLVAEINVAGTERLLMRMQLVLIRLCSMLLALNLFRKLDIF